VPDIAPDKISAVSYPPESLYETWSEHADSLDLSNSQFIIKMVEAGRRNISMDDASTASIRELLKERADLEKEIQRQRERIDDLERQLQHSTQSEIVSFVAENPGAQTPDIIQHMANSVPSRVAGHLDALEGDAIERHEDGYVPSEPAEVEDE